MTQFLIIYDDTIGIPAQGHGYSAYTKHYKEIVECKDEAEVVEWVRNNDARSYNRKTYKVYSVKQVKVDTEIKISLS